MIQDDSGHRAGMDDTPRRRFAPMRVEHRTPDGAVRVLLVTTMWSVDRASAQSWRTRLRRNGVSGELAIVREPTGDVIATFPLSDDPNTR